jgi:hypothetical protein
MENVLGEEETQYPYQNHGDDSQEESVQEEEEEDDSYHADLWTLQQLSLYVHYCHDNYQEGNDSQEESVQEEDSYHADL